MKPSMPKFVIKSVGIPGYVSIDWTEELLDKISPFKADQEYKQYYKTNFLKR